MPDSVAIAAIVGGLILIFLGLLGKGALIKVFNAEISNTISNKWARIFCLFFGTSLVIIAIGLEIFTNVPDVNPPRTENRNPPNTENSGYSSSSPYFYATSYCSMTNVYGYGEGSNANFAQEMAVNNCIYNGGIPDCCASNLRVDQQ